MPEYRVKWCQCPHVQHVTKVLFIVADTSKDAAAIARDHIERKFGIEWFSIQDVSESTRVPAGHVVGEGG